MLLVRDVTLREFGQNVPASALGKFSVEKRIWLAKELIACGFKSMELASVASPKVAPAMADELLMPLFSAVGAPPGVELITLVPSRKGFERFLRLGLGPDELGHTVGVFLSAVESHNLRNLGRTIAGSLRELSSFVPDAAGSGARIAAYVSGAFGFLDDGAREPEIPDPATVMELADQLVDMGASSVTVSDLQGVADPVDTSKLVARLSEHLSALQIPLGYHPHHTDSSAAIRNVAAANQAGAVIFDSSLGSTGGCVTGAPGNVATEELILHFFSKGMATGVDHEAVNHLGVVAFEQVLGPTGPLI